EPYPTYRRTTGSRAGPAGIPARPGKHGGPLPAQRLLERNVQRGQRPGGPRPVPLPARPPLRAGRFRLGKLGRESPVVHGRPAATANGRLAHLVPAAHHARQRRTHQAGAPRRNPGERLPARRAAADEGAAGRRV
ncbi:MAG: hypothetical protein AVDCRST_MAG56-6430, partial [uncultured Cytophagales bacterium]